MDIGGGGGVFLFWFLWVGCVSPPPSSICIFTNHRYSKRLNLFNSRANFSTESKNYLDSKIHASIIGL